MSEEEYESPYCEVCGTCGYIGCCGIRNFIDKHIKDKTNCKNEDLIISELINLCEYKDKVFKDNDRLNNIINELEKYLINNDIGFNLTAKATLNKVLDKLKELKEK